MLVILRDRPFNICAALNRHFGGAETLRQALEEARSAVAEKCASLEKEADKRERQRQLAFQDALEKIVHDFNDVLGSCSRLFRIVPTGSSWNG